MENTAAKQDSGLLYQVPDSARLWLWIDVP